ncbi:hypothetical protein ABB37_00747 [Leptomonas pyrrhocoris]|uniref:Uncharacterized protein n=1 Tax=Leptomonas pyrrhocoris TaxID=157538 RepID=A0A0N0E0N1_LEPPY|nr:hypothetical protein ABB37_00747 [Leptomonas pyrrhocoris]KPA86642.1 hypothetical protein ABB37_00747 [Leptomonas pyrrhocoris]|eukprot:XP_015665081.1 hypothetical protein ABB37_00747 [Leptomonas pyrrhocoris]
MSSDSSDDEDVVVLQVCANRHCQGIDDLEFDADTNQSYCGRCRALYAQTDKEGFRILLSNEDLALVKLIFDHFDKQRRGYWTCKEWTAFQDATDHGTGEPIESAAALKDFFNDEYDLTLADLGSDGPVVRLVDLENMYGGYLFNNVDALVEDSESLEQQGVLNTGVLE